MPWIAVEKRGRKPRRIGRWRAAHREPLAAWSGGVLAFLVLLALLFVVAHHLA